MMHQQQSSIDSEGSQLSKLFSANLPKCSGQHAQFTGDPSNVLMQAWRYNEIIRGTVVRSQ